MLKITGHIPFIRSEQVILDRDIANLYGIETRVFKQAVGPKYQSLFWRFYVWTDKLMNGSF